MGLFVVLYSFFVNFPSKNNFATVNNSSVVVWLIQFAYNLKSWAKAVSGTKLYYFTHVDGKSAHEYATFCQRPIIARSRQTHTSACIKWLLKHRSFKRIVSAHFWSVYISFCSFSFAAVLSNLKFGTLVLMKMLQVIEWFKMNGVEKCRCWRGTFEMKPSQSHGTVWNIYAEFSNRSHKELKNRINSFYIKTIFVLKCFSTG